MRAAITSLFLLLISSLTLNAYLIAFPQPGGQPSDAAATTAPIALANSAARASSAVNYFQHLRGLGLTLDETKPLVLSRLEVQLPSDVQPTSTHRYWDAGEYRLT
jgi:hypothetical protein